MSIKEFTISNEELNELLSKFPNRGKNSDIGSIAIEVVKKYFISLNSNTIFLKGTHGADIIVKNETDEVSYEVKGTEDDKLSFNKLKVSSISSYNSLRDGMILIRVTSIGKTKMNLHFMKYGEDFTLVEEPRWAFKKIIHRERQSRI